MFLMGQQVVTGEDLRWEETDVAAAVPEVDGGRECVMWRTYILRLNALASA